MAQSVPVLRMDDLPPGTMRRARAGGRDLVLVNLDGAVYALSNSCPHAGSTLHEGRLDGAILTCPLHGSQFDVTNGAVCRGPATSPVERFAATLEDGWVTVAL
jgi:nitrite reductase/ring-hydroxylating ferredoxin subunit